MFKLSKKTVKVHSITVEPQQQESTPFNRNGTNAKNSLSRLWAKFSCISSNEEDNGEDNGDRRSTFHCVICLMKRYETDAHGTKQCNHQVCQECLRQYFNSALTDARYANYESIECPSPGCESVFITSEVLLAFFSKDEIDKWWELAIHKAYIKNKVTCPLEGCGIVFDVDNECVKQCSFGECPNCCRGFCIACQELWHPGEIKIFEGKHELEKTLELAKNSNWCRCPDCGIIVERMHGCLHIVCRCGKAFCYRCGSNHAAHHDHCNKSQSQLNDIRNNMFDPSKSADK